MIAERVQIGTVAPWFVIGCVEQRIADEGELTAETWNQIVADARALGPAFPHSA